MSSTPSPAASAAAATTSSSSSSRRPPRKSTLTQQQKNQKRQRATQDQLLTLELEFTKNPTPTAGVRERIAEDINMTERSVQIWFQNRRAKMKVIAKKTIEEGGDCEAIPESMRKYLALQAMDKGFGGDFLVRSGPWSNNGGAAMLVNGEATSGKVVIQYFTCRSLSIGSWRRVGQNTMDLVIFYSPDKSCVTYYINNDSAGYKIEYPFSYIKNITLDSGDMTSNAEGASQRFGGLWVELYRPPNFFMDSLGSGGFYQCGDFTEDQQASKVMVHHLGGHPKVLSGQLAKLTSLESFQNRNSQLVAAPLTLSTPVSPLTHRPASQPNQYARPAMPVFQGNTSDMALQPRGHKRQRSRSVPVAMDFSTLRQPMPSFFIQHAEPAPIQHYPELIAPIPQHHSAFGPINPNLIIDTSAGYGLDLQQYPPSATTANSPGPSDYGTPALFASGGTSDTMSAPNFSTPYSRPYVSPMLDPSNMMGVPVSPLSAMNNHGAPVIADQSPPLALHRSMSADLYTTPQEHNTMPEDTYPMGNIFPKQSYSLPFRSAILEENSEEVDLSNIFHFGSFDASNTSPESANHYPSNLSPQSMSFYQSNLSPESTNQYSANMLSESLSCYSTNLPPELTNHYPANLVSDSTNPFN